METISKSSVPIEMSPLPETGSKNVVRRSDSWFRKIGLELSLYGLLTVSLGTIEIIGASVASKEGMVNLMSVEEKLGLSSGRQKDDEQIKKEREIWRKVGLIKTSMGLFLSSLGSTLNLRSRRKEEDDDSQSLYVQLKTDNPGLGK